MENKQIAVAIEIRNWVRKYNVVYKSQLYTYFTKDGREKFVGRALKKLEKEGTVYINQDTQQVASSESAFKKWDRGTEKAIWVLLDMMGQKKVELHFLASREEYPIRIVFVGDAQIFDILYVPTDDIQMVNNIFARRDNNNDEHIVIVEKPEDIADLKIERVVGYCVVKEDNSIDYYKNN